MNVERFAVDLGSHAILEAFGADLERRARVRARRCPRWRSATVVGPAFSPTRPTATRSSPRGAAPRPADASSPASRMRCAGFGRMATAEVAAVCGLPGPRAAAELWRLASEWRVRHERRLTGDLWSLA